MKTRFSFTVPFPILCVVVIIIAALVYATEDKSLLELCISIGAGIILAVITWHKTFSFEFNLNLDNSDENEDEDEIESPTTPK